jgi:hypothetical protein
MTLFHRRFPRGGRASGAVHRAADFRGATSPLIALLVVCLVAAACSSTPASSRGTPGPTAAANACSPGIGAGATTYPGWPGGTNPIPAGDVIPSLVSSQLTVGPNRFLLTVVDKANKILAAANVPIDLRFFNLAKDPNTPTSSSTGIFMDNGAGLGLYRTTVTFDCSGDWGVEVTVHQASGDATARVAFNVLPTTTTPAIGATAPKADTPTATDATGIAAISTDPQPDPDFYRLTITQAITSGKPSLIVFATPAFCQTRTCGPTLQLIKTAAAPFKGQVNMVHVEPYLMHQTSSGLQPVLDSNGALQIVPAVYIYGLQNEPFTFVVDAAGKVSAEFEGIVGNDELTAALQAVTGGTAATPSTSTAPAGSPSTGAPSPAPSGY